MVKERVSLKVEGVFLRQWGSEGGGEGMCVSREEVFVCDQGNDRIQVFTVTEASPPVGFLRQRAGAVNGSI